MTWFAVGGAAVTLIGGAYAADQQAEAGERGANAQQAAANAATAEQRRQFDLSRQDQLPYLQAGHDALRRQQEALAGNFGEFRDSPDYAFTREQSLEALQRGAAARGGFMGGGADADRLQLASGLASQQFGNYWNRLAGLAGQGQTTAGNLGGLGANMANNIGGNLMDAGNARASSYANTANAWSNFGNQAAGVAGNVIGQMGRQRPPPTTTIYPQGTAPAAYPNYGGTYPGYTRGRGTGGY